MRMLHCKEERRHTMEYAVYSSLLLTITMEVEDAVYYFPSPPYDVGGILFLTLHPSSIMGKMSWNMMYTQS